MMSFNKITIIGVGLIGGSLGLACKKHKTAKCVTGFGRNAVRLEKAVQLGAIDGFELELAPALNNADLVVLATPIGALNDFIAQLAPYLKAGCIVTDVGSAKADIVSYAEKLMPAGRYFIGGHPIAGKENSGVEAACADLFSGAKTILTPSDKTHLPALKSVTDLWAQIGSEVVLMNADQHDWILAVISHLPHMVAYCLVNTLLDLDDKEEELIALSGGGFRDFTRIAASDPVMWRDICLSNRKYLVEAIEHFEDKLADLKEKINSGNTCALKDFFESSKKVKQCLN